MKKTYTLLLTLLLLSVELISQTDQYNLVKYWNYRDRYKKFFTYIGTDPGNSIPIIKIKPYEGPPIIRHGRLPGVLKGHMEFGDAMVDQGIYICVLATEYKLLKDAGQDLSSIRNELYYAIEAVNRVDFNAEIYFKPLGLGSKNGFFIRTDIPSNFYEKWETLGDKMYAVRSDCSNGRNPQVEDNPSPDYENPFATRVKSSAKGLPLDKDGNEIFARQITTRYNHENL